ncbi:hypothetical protein ACN9VA_09015 [Staphylococcus caprae]|uniref:hypothetical protein n=1 Tax=Staphylococcus caprae TaxID=29380 RepID=UPI001C0F6D0F|nr:hypothetical protein [Staphylococcus caprae]MBU5271933.1 hypothetical protein [Staphylococcus caprae]
MTLFYRLFVIISSIIGIILAMISNKDVPGNLALVPLVYLTLFIFIPAFSKYTFSNLGITVFNFTALLRYAVSPALMALYGTNLQIGSSVPFEIEKNSVNLMIYEMIAIFVTFGVFHKYFYSYKFKIQKIKARSNIFGWLFIGLAILIILAQPGILDRYSFIWSASQLKSDTANEDVTIFALFIQLAQIVFTVGILNIIYSFYERRPNVIYLFLSIFVIIVSTSFITGTSRSSVILPLVTGLFTVLVLYEKYRKLILSASVVLSSLVIIVSTILKQQTNTSVLTKSLYHSAGPLENFNTDIQIYFSGLTNVGHALEGAFIFKPFDFNLLMSDLTHSVVFINRLFQNNHSALTLFNNLFYKSTGVNDQILPMIGQGYLYFGPLLAPIFSVFGILIIMYLDRMIFNAKSVFSLYILSYFCLKFSLFFMSNATILISFFTNFILILLLIMYLNSKVSYEKE